VDESGNYAWRFPVLSNAAMVIYICISLDLTALSIKVQTSKLQSRYMRRAPPLSYRGFT